MLPAGVSLLPLCLDVRRGALDEFKSAIPAYEAKVAELARMGVDVINPSGAPPFMVLGYANEQEFIPTGKRPTRPASSRRGRATSMRCGR
jgi:hypothetical protein